MAAQRKEDLNPIQFNPLAYTKKLEGVGFTREQAETQAEIFFGIVQEQMVSKRDLKELEVGLKRNIKELETALKLDIKELDAKIDHNHDLVILQVKALEEEGKKERELIRRDIELGKRDLKIWFGGMIVLAVGALATLMTFLSHLHN